MSAINYLPPFANSLIMHVLTNAEKLIPLRDAASLAESRRLAGMRMVTGTTSPSTRYERISVSPASCSIKSEYVIASHAFKPQYKCINYTPAWEQRKLSELLLERDEQAPQSDQYPLMAFIANQGIAPKGDRYDRSALVNDIEGKLYKRTEKGDFIYSSNNLETGSIGLNKYGNACISPVYSIFQPSGIADSDFLGRRLVRKDFIQEMVKWRQGVIYGQWRIHEADFLRLNIAVPSVDEQRLIGKLLDNLDSLITLHQRKRESRIIRVRSFIWLAGDISGIGVSAYQPEKRRPYDRRQHQRRNVVLRLLRAMDQRIQGRCNS
ncbi:restriction endonuclease subunit S [Bifidobacterium bifidum]|uniref:restriction endonuclease subunit S n=1 Tax=Bifidobacterium bifidum TaxID=1681 RepID=UPI0015F8B03B